MSLGYKLASSHFIVSLQTATSKIHAEILFKLNFCRRRPHVQEAQFFQTRRTCPVNANPAAKRPPERFCSHYSALQYFCTGFQTCVYAASLIGMCLHSQPIVTQVSCCIFSD